MAFVLVKIDGIDAQPNLVMDSFFLKNDRCADRHLGPDDKSLLRPGV